MTVAGLVMIAAGLFCGIGFVAATSRADARLTHLPETAPFDGAVRRWGLATLVLVVGGIMLLAAAVLL